VRGDLKLLTYCQLSLVILFSKNWIKEFRSTSDLKTRTPAVRPELW
jgi:hypothetical protein